MLGQIASPRHLESFNPRLELIRERVAFRNAVADWCLRRAQRSIKRQGTEEALQWNALAALAFARGCNPLVSETLEQNLLEIAQHLPRFEWQRNDGRGSARRWLHVFDLALPYGGLTTMAQRWITRNPSKGVHSIVLLAQEQPVPKGLADAVHESGGEIFIRDPNMSLLSSAIWLRKLACAKADIVVLHVLNDNIIAPTAFGVNGGPPVLLVNHAAHIFWTGAASVDMTLNIRGSELEHFWTEHYRGIPRSATLPIPISPPERCSDGLFFTAESRDQARRRLGLPADAVVLLSVGRGEKYDAIPGLDFFEVARSLLISCPQAYLLVVGLAPKGRWKELQTELNGRFAAVGLQSDLRDYHAAADIYIEGFPFGTTTALMEASVHGIPCVLAPAECPPPFGTDGIALDGELQRPANLKEYSDQVRKLIANPAERIRRGKSLAQSIGDHHCGAGWTRYLLELIAGIPEIHATHLVVQPPSPPEHFDLHWTQYVAGREQNLLLYIFDCAVSFGLTPTLDLPMYRAYRRARHVRRHDGRLRVSAPVALTLLLPLCPPLARNRLYRKVSSLCSDDGVIADFLGQGSNFASLGQGLPMESGHLCSMSSNPVGCASTQGMIAVDSAPPAEKKTLLFMTMAEAYGGAEKHLMQLLARLRGRSFRLVIVCTDTDPYSERLDHRDDVEVISPEKRPRTFWGWCRLFQKLRPHVLLFVHGSLFCFRWPQYLAARLAGVRKLYALQHLMPPPVIGRPAGSSLKDRLRQMFGWRARYAFPWRIMSILASQTICVSEAVRESLIQHYDYPPRKTLTIPNGVDLSEFGPSECQRVAIRKRLGLRPHDTMLVSTARLSPVKAVDVLIRAVAEVIRRAQECKCVLVGDGPLRQQIQDQVLALGLSGHVIFEGFQQDVKPYLQAADVFILSSQQEGLPLALVEAMACGLPCVVTDVGGNAEAISSGREGFLVEPGDVTGIADAISYLIKHTEERASMGAQAQEKARRFFDVDSSMKAIERVLLG